MTRQVKSCDSLRRRLRYGAWRTSYILWHAIVREAGVHAGGAIAIALFIAIFVQRLQSMLDWPLWAWRVPVLVGAVYASVVGVVCYRRVVAEFPSMRQQMRDRRASDLLLGGVARRRYERLKWVRVTLPMWVIMGIGVALALWLFPKDDVRAKLFLIFIACAAMAVSAWLERRDLRRRPHNLHRLCPRCGYDLSGSAERCPECGLRRVVHPAMRSDYAGYVARLAAKFDDDDPDDDEEGF
jgi:hypothetical protein